MEQLLTAKQVQEALSVDRTTIYRMLKDGRLAGVKVGNQWRFSLSELQNLISTSLNEQGEIAPDAAEVLPWLCLQPAQDVFAEMAEIGSVITDRLGIPLTRVSNSCRFCNLILETRKGRRACRQSWRQFSTQDGSVPEFTLCHAGLQYARAPITVSGQTLAFLVGGQFYAAEPDQDETKQRVETLAHQYRIDPLELGEAASSIRVLNGRLQAQISTWLSRVARTFEQISAERADLLSRLHQISEMSRFEPQTSSAHAGYGGHLTTHHYR